MTTRTLLTAGLATAVAGFISVAFSPLLTVLAAGLALAGTVLHELLHYTVAKAAGASGVTLGWDAIGPYVAYDGEMRPLVQLAPPLAAILGALSITTTTSFPAWTPQGVLTAAFLLGLHSLSPDDYAPLFGPGPET